MTAPGGDAPEPAKKKHKEKEDGRGAFMLAARSIIRRVNGVAARIARDAFTAAKAATAPELPEWLREFFESDSDPGNPLDPSNPARDLIVGAGDDAFFDAGFSSDGPSLDLG